MFQKALEISDPMVVIYGLQNYIQIYIQIKYYK